MRAARYVFREVALRPVPAAWRAGVPLLLYFVPSALVSWLFADSKELPLFSSMICYREEARSNAIGHLQQNDGSLLVQAMTSIIRHYAVGRAHSYRIKTIQFWGGGDDACPREFAIGLSVTVVRIGKTAGGQGRVLLPVEYHLHNGTIEARCNAWLPPYNLCHAFEGNTI